MATLVLSTVGNAVGGPIGAAIGTFLGAKADRALFMPGGNAVREGPRLTDLAVQSAALGMPIPLVYGTARVAGNVLWSTGLIERRTEAKQSAGGKGGKPSTTTVTFSYSVSLAIGVSGRRISRIGRIWADGKLLRDEVGQWLSPATMRVYTGEETQKPDPLIEAHEGMADAPAFRGLAYVVLEDFELAEFANRVPNLSFEVVADETLTLADLLDVVPKQVGISAVAVEGLAIPLAGLAIGRETSARAVMDGVLSIFPVSASEGGGALYMRALDAGVTRTVPQTALGAGEEAGGQNRWHVRIERGQASDLLKTLDLHYGDPTRDYQPAIQRARRQQGQSEQSGSLETALFLSADRAKRQAEQLLALNWMRRDVHQLQLPIRFADLEAGDRVTYDVAGRSISLLIEEMSIEPGRVLLSGFPISSLPDMDFDSAADGLFPAPVVESVGETQLEILDLPGLGRETGVPHIVAAVSGGSPGWKGAGLYVSRDEGESYDLVASSRAGSIMGQVLTSLAEGPTAYWDETNIFEVRLSRPDMTLESRSHLGVLNGANLAVVGDEVIQFREAFLEQDGRYRLSGLLRGRAGTEWAMTQHMPGERFVLVDGGGLVELDVPAGILGQTVLTKAVSIHKTLDDTVAGQFTYYGKAMMPLSPVHLKTDRNAAGDLAMTWVRRSRIGAAWLDGGDVPLGEEVERYELDILKNGVPVRTIVASQPSTVYGADQQIEDFGQPKAVIDIALYQIGALVGRGFAYTEKV